MRAVDVRQASCKCYAACRGSASVSRLQCILHSLNEGEFMDLEITPSIKIPDAELRLSFARSSGPGGQNVNKVSSKAVLHFDVLTTPSLPPDVRQRFLERYNTRLTNAGEVVIHSEEFRDQPRNIQACYEKLRQMVLTVLRP